MFDHLAFSEYQDCLEVLNGEHQQIMLENQLAATRSMMIQQQRQQSEQLDETLFLSQNPGARTLFSRCNAAFAQGFGAAMEQD